MRDDAQKIGMNILAPKSSPPVKAAPFVSVVVPHYNDLIGLDLCLNRLEAQSYPRAAFEIIVADNGSPQGAAEIARVINGRATLVIVAEKGAGPARNGGAALARGDVLAFIDSDCQAESEWLAAGVRALGEHDFVGGRMRVLVDDPLQMTGPEAFETVFAFNNEAYVLNKGFTVTANLLCPKVLFSSVGPFRVGVSEDYDWCRRALHAGYHIGYARAAVVGHPARKTWAQLKGKWRRLNSETYAVYAEQKGGRLKWLLKSLAMPLSAMAHTPKVLFHKGLGPFNQRLSALAVLYRVRTLRLADGLWLVASDSMR